MSTVFQRSSYKGSHRFFDFTETRIRSKFMVQTKESHSMTLGLKRIKEEKKNAKRILKSLIPKEERKARRKANQLGQIRENCERSGYSYFKLGSTKLNPITNKHSGKKEKINVSELPEREVRKFKSIDRDVIKKTNRGWKSTDRNIHLDKDGFRKNASKKMKRKSLEALK